MKRFFVFLLVFSLVYMPVLVFADKTTFSKIGTGSAVATSSGSPVQLSTTSIPCGMVIISPVKEASHDIATIYVGDANVNNGIAIAGGFKVANARGIKCLSADALYLPVTDVSLLYVDALTADGVTFMYLR